MKTRIAPSLSGTTIPDASGFERNTTVEDKQQGICGDVDGLIGVTTNDGRQIFMYLPCKGQYLLECYN